MTQKKIPKISFEKLKQFIDDDHITREVYDNGFFYRIYALLEEEVGIDCYAVVDNDNGFLGVFAEYSDAIVKGELSLTNLLEIIQKHGAYDVYPEKTEWLIN